jgi:phthiodiolone/phenolphthiodiolone dimycocerosates ketoreductase
LAVVVDDDAEHIGEGFAVEVDAECPVDLVGSGRGGHEASAEVWAKYGMRHPSGDRCRGLVDLIYHDLDPQQLREFAPTIPFELVEEFMFIGNASEIADRVSGYADNGLEHVIVGDGTGIVGGIDETKANTRQLATLVATLGKLT